MARIADETARDREQRAWQLFKSTKGTVADVNDGLFQADGFRMNLKRLCEIRKAALAGKPWPGRPSTKKETK